MAELILHIGSGKAGSTSLQKWLRRNNQLVNARGIHFMDCLGPHNQTGLACYAADDGRQLRIKKSQGLSRKDMPAFRDRLRNDIVSEVKGSTEAFDRFVASSENLMLDVITRAEARRLHRLLEPLFNSIKVLVFLRRQDRFAVSQHNDAIKRYFCSDPDPFEYIETTKFYEFLRYHKRLEMWSAVFGEENIIVRAEVDAVEEFANLVEVTDLEGLTDPVRENTALTPAAIEFLRRLNAIVGDSEESRQMVAQCHKSLSGKCKGRGLYPSRESAAKFLARFEHSNAELRRRWFPERDALFGDDFSVYPDYADITHVPSSEIERIANRKGIERLLPADVRQAVVQAEG